METACHPGRTYDHTHLRTRTRATSPTPWPLYGPLSFQGYRAEHHLPSKDTAAMISINTEGQLPAELRAQHTMVFRLGRATNKPGTTQLAHREGCGQPGLCGRPCRRPPGPRTRPRRALPHVLTHNQGQVEVDAVFIGRRQGQDCLFILESKAGPPASLAKQKLVYPTLLFTSTGRVPADMPIIPVYLRVQLLPGRIEYHFIQCRYPDPRASTPCQDTLTADLRTYRHLMRRPSRPLAPPGSTLG